MKNVFSILLVEDTASDAAMIEREISRSGMTCRFLRVDTQPVFIISLSEFCPDVILSNIYLPSFNGLDVLALVREHRPQTPIIMVTGAINEETTVECMKAGAWDCVLKDRLTRLKLAISAALEKKRFIDKKTRLWKHLKNQETSISSFSRSLLL